MSTITSGTVLGAGLLYDSDTTGDLVIKTGASATTAATFHGNTATTLNGDVYLTNISTPLRPLVSGTANTSISGGTVVDFPTIPSWAKRITVMLSGVSSNGTSNYIFQVGAGSVATTGYNSGAVSVSVSAANSTNGSSTNQTAGIATNGYTNTAASVAHGHVVFTNITGNTWVASGSLYAEGALRIATFAGSVVLSGILDRVRVTTANGTDTFDAGTINIMWE